MQWVLDYEHQRGWQPQDISKDRDGSGFDIRSVGQLIDENSARKALFTSKVSVSVNVVAKPFKKPFI